MPSSFVGYKQRPVRHGPIGAERGRPHKYFSRTLRENRRQTRRAGPHGRRAFCRWAAPLGFGVPMPAVGPAGAGSLRAVGGSAPGVCGWLCGWRLRLALPKAGCGCRRPCAWLPTPHVFPHVQGHVLALSANGRRRRGTHGARRGPRPRHRLRPRLRWGLRLLNVPRDCEAGFFEPGKSERTRRRHARQRAVSATDVSARLPSRGPCRPRRRNPSNEPQSRERRAPLSVCKRRALPSARARAARRQRVARPALPARPSPALVRASSSLATEASGKGVMPPRGRARTTMRA